VKIWQFFLLMAGALLLFGAGLFAFNFLIMPRIVHRNTVVLVPDLRGRELADAHAEVSRLGLRLTETHQRAHPSVPRGLILDQTPTPASPIRRGRFVKVVTSSGPPAGQIPELTGLSRRQAEITLQREAFRLGRVLRVRRPEVTVPTVIHQYPPAGTRQNQGQPVALVVAEPTLPPEYRMPDLRGVPLFRARQEVVEAGCVSASVTYERTHRFPPNTVMDQAPPPGSRIRKGDQVELVASTR
jgi:beta-lactam-binding protein with PASTA domain